jgi:hypothetical protein
MGFYYIGGKNMKYDEILELPDITKGVILEAVKIRSDIRNQIITLNSYDDNFPVEMGKIKPGLQQTKRNLTGKDYTVLSLYLSILKVDNPYKEKLNALGLYYEDIVYHLELEINDEELSEDMSKHIYEKHFEILFMLMYIDFEDSIVKNDTEYLECLYLSLYEEGIVFTDIIRNLILDIDLYHEVIYSLINYNPELNPNDAFETYQPATEFDIKKVNKMLQKYKGSASILPIISVYKTQDYKDIINGQKNATKKNNAKILDFKRTINKQNLEK